VAGIHGLAAEGGGDSGHASLPQQIEGGLTTGSQIGRGAIRADLAGVFAQRHLPDVVSAVLDRPLPAPPLLQPRRIRLLRGEAGQRVRPLLTEGAGLGAAEVLDGAVEATDLGQS
jgi:hypothetical protein